MNVGDRVKYRGPNDELIGALGIVMEVSRAADKIVIRFDDPFPSGHNYGKRGATFTYDRPGFFRASDLEVIEDDPFTTFTSSGLEWIGIKSEDDKVTFAYRIEDNGNMYIGDYSAFASNSDPTRSRYCFYANSRRAELLLGLKRLVNELEV